MIFHELPAIGVTPMNVGLKLPPSVAVPADFSGEWANASLISAISVLVPLSVKLPACAEVDKFTVYSRRSGQSMQARLL